MLGNVFASFRAPRVPAPPPAAVQPGPRQSSPPIYPPFDAGLPMVDVAELVSQQAELLRRLKLAYGAEQSAFDAQLGPLIDRVARYVHLLPATPANYFRAPAGLLRMSLVTHGGFTCGRHFEAAPYFAASSSVRSIDSREDYRRNLPELSKNCANRLPKITAQAGERPETPTGQRCWSHGVPRAGPPQSELSQERPFERSSTIALQRTSLGITQGSAESCPTVRSDRRPQASTRRHRMASRGEFDSRRAASVCDPPHERTPLVRARVFVRPLLRRPSWRA